MKRERRLERLPRVKRAEHSSDIRAEIASAEHPLIDGAEQKRGARKQLLPMTQSEIERRFRNRNDEDRRRVAILGVVEGHELPVVLVAVQANSVDQLLVDVHRLRPVVTQSRDQGVPQHGTVRQHGTFGQDEHILRSGGRGRHHSSQDAQTYREDPRHHGASARTRTSIDTAPASTHRASTASAVSAREDKVRKLE